LHSTRKVYVIDEILKSYGHTVLRLPPYHCDFNPIELIWADIKKFIAKNNKNHDLQSVKQFIFTSFERVSQQLWQNCIKHSKKTEDQYWISDGLTDENENLIVNFDNLSDDEEESEDEILFDENIMEFNCDFSRIDHNYCKV